MEEEKKEKKTEQPKKHCLPLIIFLAVLGLASIGILLFVMLKKDFSVSNFNENRTLEYLEEYVEDHGKICYGNYFSCEETEVTVDGMVDTGTLGDYELIFRSEKDGHKIELKQIVSVKDTIAPEIMTEIEVVSICPNEKISSFDYKVTDNFDADIMDRVEINRVDDKVVLKAIDSNGNEALKEFPTVVEDVIAPVITLNGESEITITMYDGYSDAGATVVDNCDEIELSITGSVDPNTPGTYEITYSATDNSGNTTSVTRKVNVVKPAQATGTIYLTFDDGPSVYTSALLDVLKKYNVKATFFVTGSGSDDILRREYQEGHSIGLHTYTHDYAYVYQSEENFFEDLYRIQNRVKNVTGYTSTLMRFPGGSSNTISTKYDGGQRIISKLVRSVSDKGFTYFDWNISSGDAGGASTADAVYRNVVNNLKNGGSSVILQHDTKAFSVNAVERIIKYALARGYRFDKLSASSFAAHHGVNN